LKREYRNHIEDYQVECNEDNREKVVNTSIVMAMIDELEQDANEIRDLLEPFIGLTEIKEVYNLAVKLSEKLY